MQFINHRTKQSSKNKEEVGTLKPALVILYTQGFFIQRTVYTNTPQ